MEKGAVQLRAWRLRNDRGTQDHLDIELMNKMMLSRRILYIEQRPGLSLSLSLKSASSKERLSPKHTRPQKDDAPLSQRCSQGLS